MRYVEHIPAMTLLHVGFLCTSKPNSAPLFKKANVDPFLQWTHLHILSWCSKMKGSCYLGSTIPEQKR